MNIIIKKLFLTPYLYCYILYRKGELSVVKKEVNAKKLELAAEIFKGFGNPIRIKIIDALQEKNLRVMELSEHLNYPQPIISQQLKILKSVGIVHKVHEGRNNRYALSSNQYSQMIKCIRRTLGIN